MTNAPLTTTKPKALSHPEMDELSGRIGDLVQHWGFKKIHGRIWTHLFLSSVPLDATTLVKRLKVSKALISFSVHDLLEYDVIREVARGRGRTVLYEANPNVLGIITSVLRQRERPMVAQAMTSCQQLDTAPANVKDDLQIQPEKMERLKAMIGNAQQILDSFIQSAGDK